MSLHSTPPASVLAVAVALTVAMTAAGCDEPLDAEVQGADLAVGGEAAMESRRTLLPATPERAETVERGDASDAGDRSLAPYFHVEGDDDGVDRLPLKSASADVAVVGTIAEVRLTQRFANEGDTTVEAIYVFPASTRAAVHAMTMTVGERVIVAHIEERDQARADYEQARAEGRTASLLEQQRANVFQMSVANLLPGDVIDVELTYTELLVPEDGIYEFVLPTVVGPRFTSDSRSDGSTDGDWTHNPYLHEGEAPPYPFAIDVALHAGMPLSRVASPSHDLWIEYTSEREGLLSVTDPATAGDRDFVLRYALAGEAIESGLLLYPPGDDDDEGYFLLMMEPPERVDDAQIVPREYLFIVDVSGSMNGFPLDTAKVLMGDLLGGLGPDDYLDVLVFAGANALLAPEPIPATADNVRRAVSFVDRQRGGGGTQLLGALDQALALPRVDGRSRTVVLVTDGYVSVEDEAYRRVREHLGEANLFAFGIGTSVNRALIEGLARAGMGEPFVVLEPDAADDSATRFREYVRAPVLTDIELGFDGFAVHDVVPMAVPDLFARRPLTVFGKYRGEAAGVIDVVGVAADGDAAWSLDVSDGVTSDDHAALRTLWARRWVALLDDEFAIRGDDELRDEITATGLEYELMTRFTSFVAIDSEVRADGDDGETVTQPLPLPAGVSDMAVGGKMSRKKALYGYGSGSGTLGGGGLGSRGSGLGGGGTGEGLGGLGTRGRGRGASGYGAGRATAESAGVLGQLADASADADSTAATPTAPTGEVVVLGALDKSLVLRVVDHHRGKLRACYEQALKRDPALAGKLVLTFVIGSDGSVQSVELRSSTLGDADLERCVIEVFEAMQFPHGSGIVIITYPLVFSPAS